MRLVKIQAENLYTKEIFGYSFGKIDENTTPIDSGGFLMSVLEDIFCGKNLDGFIITAQFAEGNEFYTLQKDYINNKPKRILSIHEGDELIAIATDDEIKDSLENILGAKPFDILKSAFISEKEFIEFCEKGFDIFEEFNLPLYQQDLMHSVTEEDISKAEQNVTLLSDVLSKIKERHIKLQEKLAESPAYALKSQLKKTRDLLKEMEAKKPDIEEKRKVLAEYNSVSSMLPKFTEISMLSSEIKELENQIEESKKELGWYEAEYENVKKQLSEKEKELYKTSAARVSANAVLVQFNRSKEFEAKNQKLKEHLATLSSQLKNLQNQRLNIKNSLNSVDEAINEVKSSMDEFTEPDKHFADLLESVRINAKIDELEAQAEKLRAEIVIKESQIADREKVLVNQTRQLRSIMQIDNAVAPYKAREIIMSILDYKSDKLNRINSSLKDKMRNLTRAKETHNYRLTGITQSEEILEKELSNLRKVKGEQFKREVLINSQKIYQDATAVYAVQSDMNDDEVKNLENLLQKRRQEKQKVLAVVSRITGAIEEIQRHIDINQAEITSLNEQKQDLIERYNRLIHENTNEKVANYLRAIETDKGTNYLLEVSADAVKTETEIKDLKNTLDSLRLRLADIESRLRQLHDTKSIIDGDLGTMDSMLHINEQARNELTDTAMRLSAVFERQRINLGKLEEIDLKINRVQEVIVETEKTIKLNEREIETALRQSEKLAGGDAEKVFEKLKAEEREIQAEIAMLLGSKSTLEEKYFAKRLAHSQYVWLKEHKDNELREQKAEFADQLALMGVDALLVEKLSGLAEESINKIEKEIDEYDQKVEELSERAKMLAQMLAEAAPLSAEINSQIEQLNAEMETTKANLAAAEDEKRKLLETLAAASFAQKQQKEAVDSKINALIDESNSVLNECGLTLSYKNKLKAVYMGEEKPFEETEKWAQLAAFVALKQSRNTVRGKNEFLIFDSVPIDNGLSRFLSTLGYSYLIQLHRTPKEETGVYDN